jgi:hypothetical protein
LTGQEPDRVYYLDEKYDLVGFKGKGLSFPIDFGIETQMRSTNCRRGYIMRYKISEDTLKLDGFWFNTNNEELPLINEVKPIKITEEIAKKGKYPQSLFEYEYENVGIVINFNGNLLIAKDFIKSEYVHMGFQSSLSYKTVLKIHFKDGIIDNVEDKTKEAKKSRKKGKRGK